MEAARYSNTTVIAIPILNETNRTAGRALQRLRDDRLAVLSSSKSPCLAQEIGCREKQYYFGQNLVFLIL